LHCQDGIITAGKSTGIQRVEFGPPDLIYLVRTIN